VTDLVYLDNAATSFPKPEAVYRAVDRTARELGVSPGRSGSDLAVEAAGVLDGCRAALADLFRLPGRDPDRVVFAANATDALNTAIAGVCRPGDHVVSTRLEHNSVLRPLWELTRRGVITHDLVPCATPGRVDPADVAAALRPDTRLVVLTHASNVLGTLQDAAAVGALCRERGVLLLLDAAQTAGAAPIDMAGWGVDLLAFTGHKGLLGPTGTGGLAVAPDVPVVATRWGGTGVRSAERGHLEEFPYRLEAGTHNLSGVAGLAAGLAWLTERDVSAVAAHELALAARLAEGAAALPGVRVHAWDGGPRVGVVSVSGDGMPADEVGIRLDVDHGVLVRTGLQCAPLVHEDLGTVGARGTARFSFGPFNTIEHVDRALAGLAECAETAAARR